MKKIVSIHQFKRIYLFVFLFSVGYPSAFAYQKIKVDLKFGVKEHRCRGFGICLIFNPDPGPSGQYSSLSIQNDKLMLEIPLEKTKENPDAFQTDYFIMDGEYLLSEKISRQLGYDLPLIIYKGKYPMKRNADSFQLEFQIE
jgi:hypothetical protein